MFGEKNIIGEKVVSLDNKGRLYLPTFTFAEENEELVLLTAPSSSDYLEIYNSKYIDNLIFYNNLEKSPDLYKIKKEESEELLKRTICYLEVDCVRRVNITTEIKKRYNISSKPLIKGLGNHINVYKDEETFLKLERKK